ncbi:hypothetical protein JCM15519_06270 [Fundidesulfovibrio butyratiphilus]
MPSATLDRLPSGQSRPDPTDFSRLQGDPTDWDREVFAALTSAELTPQQARAIVTPETVHPRQDAVLALHWHPEQVPLDLAAARVAAMFPNSRDSLIIPTQHNQLLTLGQYAGVEVDCYSHGFNRKVQLLVHLHVDRLPKADVLRSMLEHTHKYRATQLFDFLEFLGDPRREDARAQAAGRAGSDEEVVEFCTLLARRLKQLILLNESTMAVDAFKNKLVRNYCDALRAFHGAKFVGKAQVYLKAVKEEVKEHFSLAYFYRTSEIIDEVRGLGGGIVIPHPEQFWPILLADYDVDGIEVWNPQSQQYTEFLINVVDRRNKAGRSHGRDVLIFMGDDCHLSEKLKAPEDRDPAKASREVGLQPAWDDLLIRKSLIITGVSRKAVMDQYRERLA